MEKLEEVLEYGVAEVLGDPEKEPYKLVDVVDIHRYLSESLPKHGFEYSMEKCNDTLVNLVKRGKLMMWYSFKSYNEGFTCKIAYDNKKTRELRGYDESLTNDAIDWLYGLGDYSQG